MFNIILLSLQILFLLPSMFSDSSQREEYIKQKSIENTDPVTLTINGKVYEVKNVKSYIVNGKITEPCWFDLESKKTICDNEDIELPEFKI